MLFVTKALSYKFSTAGKKQQALLGKRVDGYEDLFVTLNNNPKEGMHLKWFLERTPQPIQASSVHRNDLYHI